MDTPIVGRDGGAARVAPEPIGGAAPAKSGAARWSVLSRALHAFAAGPADDEPLIDGLARILTDGIGGGCAIRLLSEAGQLAPAVVQFPLNLGPRGAAAAARLRVLASDPLRVSEHAAAQSVLETGASILVPRLEGNAPRSAATSEMEAIGAALGVTSLLLIALRVRGESLGLLSLFRFAPTMRPFDEQDRELAQAFADHAALAISHTRLLGSMVTERAHRQSAERAAAKAIEQVRHADRLATVGKLIAGVAHELGSPLNVIGGHAQLIAAHELQGDEIVQSARLIAGQVNRAATIVRQLLDFARRSAQPEGPAIDALVVAKEVVALLSSSARKSGVCLMVEGQPVEVQVDEECLRQIFTNLLMNAMHASSAGQDVVVAIDRVCAQRPGTTLAREFARAEVRDRGTGMSDAVRAQAFEPFFTTKAKGAGTGLGLSVVEGIVEEHGGWIAVSTAPECGATFSVFLPLAQPGAPRTACTNCPPATADRTPCDVKSRGHSAAAANDHSVAAS